jgi:hypothetical protein
MYWSHRQLPEFFADQQTSVAWPRENQRVNARLSVAAFCTGLCILGFIVLAAIIFAIH